MYNKYLNNIILILLFPMAANAWSYKWSGKGKLYDERNQYYVTCRLTHEKNVDP